jgi:hypothetical protein
MCRKVEFYPKKEREFKLFRICFQYFSVHNWLKLLLRQYSLFQNNCIPSLISVKVLIIFKNNYYLGKVEALVVLYGFLWSFDIQYVGWRFWNTCVTNYHGYVPLVNTSLSFPHSRFITWFVTRLTRRVSLVEQELPTLPEHLSSLPVLVGFV